jgi:hypothetical protein
MIDEPEMESCKQYQDTAKEISGYFEKLFFQQAFV